MSMKTAPAAKSLTHETLYLLAKLDLHTERLLAEAEEIVIANANREAAGAALQDAEERVTL